MSELEVVSFFVRWVALMWALLVAYRYPGPRSLVLLGLVLVSVVLQATLLFVMGARGTAHDPMGMILDMGSMVLSGFLLAAVALTDRSLRELATSRDLWVQEVARHKAADLAKQAELRARALQQEAVAGLGRRILASGSVSEILDDAVHTITRTLDVEGAELFEFSPHRRSLLLRAAAGAASEEPVGTAISSKPEHYVGLALARGQRVLAHELDVGEYKRPPFESYARAGSAAAVVVPGRERPFGILSAHHIETQRFSEEDAHFLQGVANLLAAAIEQDRARAEVDRGRERAFLAQKLEALGRLSGGIAHDFNNVLHAIVGNTELALARIPDDAIVGHNLRQVLIAAQRARNLIQQILAFGLRSHPERETVRVESVVDEVLVLMKPLGNKIEVRKQVGSPDLAVIADSTQLYQVLVNLCTNAGHAMRDAGGRLDIEIDAADVDARERRELGLRTGAYVRIAVRDTGHGIRPEIRDRIFEPFFTAGSTPESPGEGTGMGLAVVHGIVEGHGGAIRFESERSLGTTFEVFLPRAEPAVGVEQPARSTIGEKPREQPVARVLFVDDELPLVTMTNQALRELDYDVVGLTSSEQALERFRADPQRFDVVVMDQNMPGLRGDALTKELLALRPDLPVILCTGYTGEFTAEAARELGVREYLTKPLAIETLASAIRRVLDISE